MPLTPGSRLGPYEILAPIGAGGMGEVYRAKDPRLGREVAIKVLPASFSADADRLRRFEQEARAAGVLNHPNITAVHDIGTHEGAPYVVQELLEGETLRSVLSGGRLPAAQDDRLLPPDRPRPRGGAREGHRPPGPQAREHLRDQRRPREDPRLRPRQAHAHRRARPGDEPSDRDRRHGTGRRHGHARLHVARAGARQTRRRALGHLLLRRDPLRDALGKACLPRRLGRGHDVGDPQGRPAGPLHHQPEHLAGPRAHRPPLPREESRAALPLRARCRLRPRGAFGPLDAPARAVEGPHPGPPSLAPRRGGPPRRPRDRPPRRPADMEDGPRVPSHLPQAHLPPRTDPERALCPRRELDHLLGLLGRRPKTRPLLDASGKPRVAAAGSSGQTRSRRSPARARCSS